MTENAICDKATLCEKLGWSKPRLDRRLDADTNFPVRKRGTQAGGWEFELDVVLAYLAQGSAKSPRRSRSASSPETMAGEETRAPPAARSPAVEHRGEATAKQRRDEAQAALLEDKLRRDRGELVEAEGVRIVVSTALARLAKGLDALPDAIVKQLGLKEHDGERIASIISDLRRALASDLAELLKQV